MRNRNSGGKNLRLYLMFLLWKEMHTIKPDFVSLILVLCRNALLFPSEDLGQMLLNSSIERYEDIVINLSAVHTLWCGTVKSIHS